MIPIPTNIPWRLIGAAAVAAVIGLAVWKYGHSRYEAGREVERAAWQAAVAEAGAKFAAALEAQQRLLERTDAALAEARRQGQINRRDLDDALDTPDGRDWGATPLPDSVRAALQAARDPAVSGDP